MDPQTLLTAQNLAYLLASILFIFGLKGLTHPRTAVRGNLTGSFAMLLAVVATLAGTGIVSWGLIIVGLAVGSVIGTIMALKVPMTGMPQMVAVFNGFGGGASFLVAGAELIIQLGRSQAGAPSAHSNPHQLPEPRCPTNPGGSPTPSTPWGRLHVVWYCR